MDEERSAVRLSEGFPGTPHAGRGSLRFQLEVHGWLRLVIITTSLITTLLIDRFVRPEVLTVNLATSLYVLQAVALVLAIIGLALARRLPETPPVVVFQFGGDVLIETALLALFGEAAVPFVLALFFLTTLLACSCLNRVQGGIFAVGSIVFILLSHLAGRLEWLPPLTTRDGLPPFSASSIWDLYLRLFLIVGTGSATAWFVGRRQMALQSVTENLQELQRFSESIASTLTSGLITLDERGLVAHVNRYAQELLGWDQHDVVGRDLYQLLGWEPAEERSQPRGVPTGTEPTRTRSIELMVGDRQLALDLTWSSLQDRLGRTIGHLVLLEDVTELRQLEASVRQQETMAVVGQMAAGIAHEIRNPLASISGSVQVLQRQLVLNEQQSQLMDIVLTESRRLDDIIGDFLAFARPRPPRPRPIDLAELAQQTLTLLSNGQDCQDHHELSLAAPEPVPSSADPDQVRQVLWNLCRNALRAMPDGGRLEVAAELDDDNAILAVSDTGAGMSAEALAHAFEPMKGEFGQGTGMGLAIVYRIVKDHDGEVSIDSEPGRGTRVEVRLPHVLTEAVAEESWSA
ncbi:MAG: ATP-binding protein [Acidobacteriota bacterium]